jgi:hypothetical protein
MLTDAQARSLTIGLQQIERELAWIEKLLSWTYEGAMVCFVDDLQESSRQRLRDDIGTGRRLIEQLRDTLGLHGERIAKSRWIAGHLVPLWVVAEECQSRYLRGYGPVTRELPPLVDPLARRLGELLIAMATQARPDLAGSSAGGIRDGE